MALVPATPPSEAAFEPVPSAEESLELLRQARAGDRAALGELLERHRERLRRIVRLRMGAGLRGVLDSVDLVQETYLAATRGFPGFEGEARGSLIHWLARIAENQVRDAADRWSAQRRDHAREISLGGQGSASGEAREAPGRDPTPSEEAGARELRELYDACVAELAPNHREIVLLRDYELCEWPEVAARLGAGVHAAQELHRRARLRLAEALERRLSP